MTTVQRKRGFPLSLRLSLCFIGAAAVLAVRTRGPRPSETRLTRARYLMGTVLEIDVFGPDALRLDRGVEAAFEAVDSTERRLSNWRADSELSRINRQAFRHPVVLSPETWRSLSAAFRLAEETDGAFDPTVGAVTLDSGGLAGEGGRSPATPGSVGWRFVALDPDRRTVALDNARAAIDSGGFGKGEALDRAASILKRRGAVVGRLNFGGQILLFGTETATGRAAALGRVAIAGAASRPEPPLELSIGDGSLSTSGDSEKPGHLIDARTGRASLFHGSVTVLAHTALRADALSTALFVLGPKEGIAYADRRGIPALWMENARPPHPGLASRSFARLASLPRKEIP